MCSVDLCKWSVSVGNAQHFDKKAQATAMSNRKRKEAAPSQ